MVLLSQRRIARFLRRQTVAAHEPYHMPIVFWVYLAGSLFRLQN